MIARSLPDLHAPDLDNSAPCDDYGWPTFVFVAPVVGYESPLQTGPLSVKWVLSGVESYRFGGSMYRAQPETLLVLNHGVEYWSEAREEDKTTSFCVFFNQQLVEQAGAASFNTHEELLENPEIQSDAFIECGTSLDVLSSNSSVAVKMKQLLPLVDDQSRDGRLIEAMNEVLGEVLKVFVRPGSHLLLPNVRKRSTRLEIRRRITASKSIIHDCVGDRISLEELARGVCMSPFHFQRCFTQLVGKSPLQYAIDLKIEVSKRMLATTTTPILDIAQSVGYEDSQSFHKTFMRLTGRTPSSYRSTFKKQ